MTFYPQLIEAGRVYILDTPLFRVRNKKQNIYCYNETEKTKAIKELKNAEVTRFKGLGELSDSDFRAFVGEGMRLVKIEVSDFKEANDAMHFYMGKNTQTKHDFIMRNLVILD